MTVQIIGIIVVVAVVTYAIVIASYLREIKEVLYLVEERIDRSNIAIAKTNESVRTLIQDDFDDLKFFNIHKGGIVG